MKIHINSLLQHFFYYLVSEYNCKISLKILKGNQYLPYFNVVFSLHMKCNCPLHHLIFLTASQHFICYIFYFPLLTSVSKSKITRYFYCFLKIRTKKTYLPKVFSMYRLWMRNWRAPSFRFWLRFGHISGGKLYAFINLAISLLIGL